jgi:hypothetical protein
MGLDKERNIEGEFRSVEIQARLAMALLEVLVLTLAASGILAVGH